MISEIPIVKGDTFVFNDSVYVKVRRVAKNGTWADLKCNTTPDIDATPGWTKRQPLPLASSFQPWTPGKSPNP